MEKKKKGIEQFLPTKVIFQGVLDFVETGKVDREKILEEVKEYNKGDNRANKAKNGICAILENDSKLRDALRKNYSVDYLINLSQREKSLLVISLITLKFPTIYDTLCILGKLFKLQDTVNTQVITDSLAELYGANSTFHHTVYGVIEILVDAQMIKREKPGLYSVYENIPVNSFITECWFYAYYVSNDKKPFAIDNVNYLSWFKYLEFDEMKWNECKILKTRTENSGKVWVE